MKQLKKKLDLSIPIIKKKKLSLLSHEWLACLSQKRLERRKKREIAKIEPENENGKCADARISNSFWTFTKGELEGL